MLTIIDQIGTWYSQTTNGSPIPRRSNSYKWRMRGNRHRQQVGRERLCCLDLHPLLLILRTTRQVRMKKQVDVESVFLVSQTCIWPRIKLINTVQEN
jgi:hypothetical protein